LDLRKTSVLILTLRGSIRKPEHDIAVKHTTPGLMRAIKQAPQLAMKIHREAMAGIN